MPGSGHWFSAHFTPLMYVFALLYRLNPAAETLVVIQFLALSAAVPALFLYARKVLGSRTHALAVAALLALYPTYQYIHLYEFEMLRFCIPLLLLTFYFLESGAVWPYWLFLTLSLLVREEVAITTACMGLHACLFLKERRWTGIATTAISILYFLAATQIIMPSFHGGSSAEHVAAYWFASLGHTMPEVLKGIFTKPAIVFALITDPIKLANLFMLNTSYSLD
jgi:uncharacterized membrane protein